MEEKTEVFKRVAGETNDRQWKSFCDTLKKHNTHSPLAIIQTNGGLRCEHQTPPPSPFIDARGAVLKTNKEKGLGLLQRFVQQSNENNLDEWKTVWKGLDRNLTEAGSNDDLITEALLGLSKDTTPGPDKVKYSDIKNLSVDNKNKLLKLYEESFVTGQVPEDWPHSYLKPIRKPGKDYRS